MIKKLLIPLILSLLLLTGCQSQEVVDGTQLQKNRIEQAKANQELAQDQSWHNEELVRYRNFSGILNIFLILSGIGLGGGILMVGLGGGFYTVQVIKKKSELVYANENGQFPLVITRGEGFKMIHDPNRQFEATTSLSLPTVRQQLAAVRNAEISPLPKPLQLTDGRMQLKVTTQAQYHQMMQAIKIDPALKRMHQRGMLNTVVESTKELEQPIEATVVEPKPQRVYNVVDHTDTLQLT